MSVFVWVLAEAEDLEFEFEVGDLEGEANTDVASVVDCVEEILAE